MDIFEALQSVLDKSGLAYKIGQEAEDEFLNLVKKRFPERNIKFASEREEKEDHIDFKIDGKKYEVKGMKTLKGVQQDKWVLIEFKTIHGYPGWIYGKADFIAFKVREGFLVVPRIDLLRLANEKIDKNTYVMNNDDALYKVYARIDRGDLIGRIQRKDIETEIPHEIWHPGEIIPLPPETIKFRVFITNHPEKKGKKQTHIIVRKDNKEIAKTKIPFEGKRSEEDAPRLFQNHPEKFEKLTIENFKEWLFFQEIFNQTQ